MRLNNLRHLISRFVACLLNSQRVETDYDHSVNFGVYRTYSWKNIDAYDPLLITQVMKAVDAPLSEKGLKRVPWDGNISLFAMAVIENHEPLKTFLKAVQCDWSWGAKGDRTGMVEDYKLGTFVLEMLDTRTKRLVWRGSANETISTRTTRTLGSLERTVERMLKHFPPRAPWIDQGVRHLP